ncbi:MAG: AAA family ATPase [Desulfobacteraceae bacterium]|jgi:flagellar biosynthesis protein FlhF
MNIRKFIARNSSEAIKTVKKEMGEEAVILRTKTIPGQGIEVTAAVDYDAQPVKHGMDVNTEIKEMGRELREIKEALLFSDACRVLDPELYYDQDLRERYTHLKTFGLNQNLIRKLMSENRPDVPNKNQNRSHLLQDSLMKVLTKIKVSTGRDVSKGKRIYTFIGPTGVGKTTTLAKLAAQSALENGMKSVLITLDTFRIAAAAQLEAYARIMGLPVEVAVSGKDLQKAIRKYNDYDRIFIDTAGRSPNGDQGSNDLLKLFKDHDSVHGFLVMSATTQYWNMINTSDRFENLPFHSYIFSKIDETEDLSPMINFLITKEKPVSYFTTGQQVPEDIETASKKKLASFLLSGIREESDIGLNEGKYNGSSCRA